MSNPVKICTTCDRKRDCMLHQYPVGRGATPPERAEKWLRKTCPNKGKGCEITYHAGIIIGPRPCGQ